MTGIIQTISSVTDHGLRLLVQSVHPLPRDVDILVWPGVAVVDHVERVAGQGVAQGAQLRGWGHGSGHGVAGEINRVVVVTSSVDQVCLHHSDSPPGTKIDDRC